MSQKVKERKNMFIFTNLPTHQKCILYR